MRKNKLFINKFSYIILIMFIFTLISIPRIETRAESNTSTNNGIKEEMNDLVNKVRILEIAPGNAFRLTNGSKINPPAVEEMQIQGIGVIVTHLSMPEYISMVDEISGKYDIVVITNDNSNNSMTPDNSPNNFLKSNKYRPYSAPFIQKMDAVKYSENSVPKINGVELVEYYPENDITKKRSKEIVEMIEKGQLVCIDNGILSNLSSKTNLVNIFSNNELKSMANYKRLDKTNINLENVISLYKESTINKRPKVDYIVKPESETKKGELKREMKFTVSASTKDNIKVRLKLYLDVNADGLYTEDELFLTKDEEGSSNFKEYTLIKKINKSFVGYLDWKVEIIELKDDIEDVKTYVTSNLIFKAHSGKRKIRVLQVYPNSKLVGTGEGESGLKSLLTDQEEFNKKIILEDYEVSIDSITTSDFCKPSNYGGADGFDKLKEDYDMIIIGFADNYNHVDFTSQTAMKNIEAFIRDGNSIMFTHDTMSLGVYKGDSSSGPGLLTRGFRDYVGQARYKDPFRLEGGVINEKNIYRQYDPESETYIYKDIPHDEALAGYYSLGQSSLVADKVGNLWNSGKYLWKSTSTEQIRNINSAQITSYPYKLNEFVAISRTHTQWFQLNLEDPDIVPWYNLVPNPTYSPGNGGQGGVFSDRDSRNFYHTYSRGNITYSGTGHLGVSPKEEEIKLFVNTIIRAYRGANHAPDIENTVEELDETTNEVESTILEDGDTYEKEISRLKDFEFITIPTDEDLDRLKVSVSVKGTKLDNKYIKLEEANSEYKGDLIDSDTKLKVTIPKEHYENMKPGDSFQVEVKVSDDMDSVKTKTFNLVIENIPPMLTNYKLGYLENEEDDQFIIKDNSTLEDINLNGEEDFTFLTIPRDEDNNIMNIKATSEEIGYSEEVKGKVTGDKVLFKIPKEKFVGLPKNNIFEVKVTVTDEPGDSYTESFKLIIGNHKPTLKNYENDESYEVSSESFIPNNAEAKTIAAFGKEYKFITELEDVDLDDDLTVKVYINGKLVDLKAKKKDEEDKRLSESTWLNGDKLQITIPREETLNKKGGLIDVLVRVTDTYGDYNDKSFKVRIGPNNPPTLENKDKESNKIIKNGEILKNAIKIGNSYLFKTIPFDSDGDLLKVTVSVYDDKEKEERVVAIYNGVISGNEINPITIDRSHYGMKFKGETFKVIVRVEDTDNGIYEESFNVGIQDNAVPSLENYEEDGLVEIPNKTTSINNPKVNRIFNIDKEEIYTEGSLEGEDFNFVTIPKDSDDEYVNVIVKVKTTEEEEARVVKTIVDAKTGVPLDISINRGEFFNTLERGETFEVLVTVEDSNREPIVSKDKLSQTSSFEVLIKENEKPSIKNYELDKETLITDESINEVVLEKDYIFNTKISDNDDEVGKVTIKANGVTIISEKFMKLGNLEEVTIKKEVYSEITRGEKFKVETKVEDSFGGISEEIFLVKTDENHPPTLKNYSSEYINKIEEEYKLKDTTPSGEENILKDVEDKKEIMENTVADTIKSYKDYKFITIPMDEDEYDKESLTIKVEARGVSLEPITNCKSGEEVIITLPKYIYEDMTNNSEFEVKVTVIDTKGVEEQKTFKLRIKENNPPEIENKRDNPEEGENIVIKDGSIVKTMKYHDYTFNALVNDIDDIQEEEGDKMSLKVLAGDEEILSVDNLSDNDSVRVTIDEELYSKFTLEDSLKIRTIVSDSHGKSSKKSFDLMIQNYKPEIANKDGKENIETFDNAVEAQKNAIKINKYEDFTFNAVPTDRNSKEDLKVSVKAQIESDESNDVQEITLENNIVKSGIEVNVTIPKSVYKDGIPNTYIHIISTVEDEFGETKSSDFYLVIDDIDPNLYHGILKGEKDNDIEISEKEALVRNYELTQFGGRLTNLFLSSKNTPIQVKLKVAEELDVIGDVSIYRIKESDGLSKKSKVWKMSYDSKDDSYIKILTYDDLIELGPIESEGMTLIIRYDGLIDEKSTKDRKDYTNKIFTKQLERSINIYTQDKSIDESVPLF